MSDIQLLIFAYLTGLAVTGMTASIAEALFRMPVTFLPPYVTRERIIQSLAFTVVAGPAMLMNDAMDASRTGAISLTFLAFVVLVVNVWLLALGIVALQLVNAGLTLLH